MLARAVAPPPFKAQTDPLPQSCAGQGSELPGLTTPGPEQERSSKGPRVTSQDGRASRVAAQGGHKLPICGWPHYFESRLQCLPGVTKEPATL